MRIANFIVLLQTKFKIMLKKFNLVLIVSFCVIFSAFAQKQNFKITIHDNNSNSQLEEGTMTYLVGYYGYDITIYDSVPIKKNCAAFKGKNLPDGYYEMRVKAEVGTQNCYLRFIVSEGRKFDYWMDAAGHIEGSDENVAYQLAHFQINTEDGTWTPPMSTLEEATHGHNLALKYLALEYGGLDYCTTSDPRLLRHPLFTELVYGKITSEKVAVIDSVFDRFGVDTEIGQYFLEKALKYYFMDNNVAYDDILLHLYDKYYIPNNLQLFSENFERRLKKGIERKRHMSIGAEVPVIRSKEADGHEVSTDQMQRQHIVVWFWDADCEDCLEETPILNQMYIEHQDDYDFDVYGYCITADVNRWKKVTEEIGIQFPNTCDGLGGNNYDVIDYFNILTTPACLLLDADHKIIMRQFSLEELENFFNDLNPDKYNEE